MKVEYIVLIVAAVSLIWQLQICFSGKSMKKKCLPGLVLLAAIAVLALFAAAGNWLYRLGLPIYSAPYGAAVFAMMLAIPLAGIALAWAVWGIVKLVQKRK